MKKLVKRFGIVACVLLFVAPVLSACFMTTYAVSFDFDEGGEVEVRIGDTIVEHASRQIHNKTLVIVVTPSGFNEIKSVQVNSVELVGENGEYTYVLRGHVTIKVEFYEFETEHPCVVCGSRNSTCKATPLGLERLEYINALLNLANSHADNKEALDIINIAIDDIRVAPEGAVINIYLAAVKAVNELSSEPIPDCVCGKNCVEEDCDTLCDPRCCFCCIRRPRCFGDGGCMFCDDD